MPYLWVVILRENNMKKRIGIILVIAAIAGFLVSCGSTQDCPAYNSHNCDNQEQVEQPA